MRISGDSIQVTTDLRAFLYLASGLLYVAPILVEISFVESCMLGSGCVLGTWGVREHPRGCNSQWMYCGYSSQYMVFFSTHVNTTYHGLIFRVVSLGLGMYFLTCGSNII